MMKKTKKTLIFAFLATLGLAVPLGTAELANADGNGVWTTSLFEAGETTLQARAYMDGRVDTGLQVNFPRSGSVAQTKHTQMGDFSLEYAPTKVVTQYTVGELQVNLTDVVTGKEITISAVHNVGEYSVSVIFEDTQAGIYYEGGKATGLTPVANASGLYTVLKGETLSLSYDADTMQVLAGVDGAVAKLVWDLSTATNDCKTIDGSLQTFGEYSVELVAQNVAGDNGSVVLYSMNETSLEGFLVEESPISVYAEVSQYGLVNKEYTLPKGYVSSLGGGVREQTILPTVKYNGTVVCEGQSTFKTKTAGEYTLEYAYGDEVKSYSLQVFEEMPAIEPIMQGEFPEMVALGETKYLPRMEVYGGLEKYKSNTAKISIVRDGIALLLYTEVNSGLDYTFQKAGKYQIYYTFEGQEIACYELELSGGNNFLKSENLKEEYTIGEKVDLTDVCASIGGTDVQGEISVVFPSGKAYANQKFFLSEVGKYTVAVDVVYGEEKYRFEKEFEVVSAPQDLFETTEGDLSIDYGTSDFTQRQGVRFTAKSSNLVFSYKNKINLKNYVDQTTTKSVSGKDIITLSENARPLIELSIDPAAYNEMAATGFTFYITDAENPDNKITITAVTAGINGSTWAYVKSYAPGNTARGLGYDSSSKDVTYAGVGAKLHVGNAYGTMIYHSFKGTTVSTFSAKDSKIAIYYDSEKKQILVPAPNQNYHCVSMDLDDPLLCGGSIWEGFSGDEVYISGAITGVKTSQAKAVVYKVDGLDLEQGRFDYDEKPTVTVASESSTLQSVKGKTISLPSATAQDKYGNAVENIVAKAYYKNGEHLIDANVVNGRLTTEKAGEYIAKYFAKDCFGNVGEAWITVKVMETLPTMTASTDGAEEDYLEYRVTDRAEIMPTDKLVVNGAIDRYDITAKVYFKESDWTEVQTKDGTFFVGKYGEYKVEYVATDFVGNTATTSYTFTVQKPTETIFADGTPSYKAFISENTYDIFDLYVLDFENSNGDQIKTDVYIDGALYTESSYTAQKLVKTLEGYQEKSVSIEYKLGERGVKSYQVSVIPVFVEVEVENPITGAISKDEKYVIEQYFYGNETISVKAETRYSVLTSTNNDSTVTFAYPLNSEDIAFVMDIHAEKNANLAEIATNVQGVLVRLQDSKRENNYLEFRIARAPDDNYAAIFVNGNRGFENMSGSFVGVTGNAIAFRYDNDERALYDGNSGTLLYAFTQNQMGEVFNGFEGEVYLTLGVESTDNQAVSMRLTSLNGYSLGTTNFDSSAPSLIVNGDAAGAYEAGAKVVIPTATASDLFCDIASVTVRAYNVTTGATLKDVTGKEIQNLPANQEYEFVLPDVGNYQVEYLATNVRGATSNKSFLITAAKQVKPVLTIQGEMIAKVKLGETYVLPSYEVTYQSESMDNFAFVVFMTPTNKHLLVAKDMKVTFERRGVHKVRYYAADSYGNYEWKEFVIVCE